MRFNSLKFSLPFQDQEEKDELGCQPIISSQESASPTSEPEVTEEDETDMQPGPAQNEPELTPSSSTAEPAGRFVCMCMCVGVC